MKRFFMILFIIVLSLVLVFGCGKSGDKDKRASATQKTDTNGQVNLTLQSVTVSAIVQDSLQHGLSNIDVYGYLTHNNVLLEAFDSTGHYYPSITITPLTASKCGYPGHVESPDEIASTSVEATLTLFPVDWGALGLTEVSGFDNLVGDNWTDENWHTGLLFDMYNFIDSSSAYDRGVFINLTQNVHDSTNSQFRTAIFLGSQISNFATFASLVGAEFQLFSEDTIHFASMTYDNSQLPIIYVDNIYMHRNFWAQFTLRWNEEPRDLDSHLWTPPINDSTYHIYFPYYSMGNSSAAPFALLDVDDQYSYGPEHMTIYQNFPGTYTYAVYHWTGTGTLATSGASVSLLRPNGDVQVFTVPTNTQDVGPNWWWYVCTIDGTTGVVTPIDSLAPTPPVPFNLKTAPAKQ
jgi:hypothetical protein